MDNVYRYFPVSDLIAGGSVSITVKGFQRALTSDCNSAAARVINVLPRNKPALVAVHRAFRRLTKPNKVEANTALMKTHNVTVNSASFADAHTHDFTGKV